MNDDFTRFGRLTDCRLIASIDRSDCPHPPTARSCLCWLARASATMASWHPDPQSLNDLYHLIINSKSTDSDTRSQASVVRPNADHITQQQKTESNCLVAPRACSHAARLHKLPRLHIRSCDRPVCRPALHSRPRSEKQPEDRLPGLTSRGPGVRQGWGRKGSRRST